MVEPRALALVALGGAGGATARAALGALLPTGAGQLPVTTLLVNLVGALLLGLLNGLVEGWKPFSPGAERRQMIRLAVGTGFLGGLTTHSTYVLEASGLAFGGNTCLGAAYLLGSFVAGTLLAALGLGVGGGLARRISQNRQVDQ